MRRMNEKLTMWVGIILLTLLIPYGLTMALTGVIGQNTITEEFKSGIVIHSEAEGNIDLEDYVIGILASQMPIDYDTEALKAQAVIARTNIMRSMEEEKSSEQADLPFTYITKDQMKENWGEKNVEKNYNKLRLSVSQTQGITMKSEGEYIDALYHAVSIGTTVSAKEMYGKDVPYLISADSSRDVESPDYMTMTETSYDQAVSTLKKRGIAVTVDMLKNELKITEKTALGYVKKVKVQDTEIQGDTWQNIFSLNSTNFYLEDYQGMLRMICLGKGNGLGLSQYGANEMAKDGKNYEEILKYYYHDITMNKIAKTGNATTEVMNDEAKQ